MALDLGVSRQSIREAIYRAKIEGLLEVKQGGGTFVISSIKGTLRPPLSIFLEQQAERILEFLEMRKVIEGWCAERAAETASAGDLRKMERTLSRMEKARLSVAAWEKADLDFHSSIAAATHNVIAMHVMEGLKDSFQTFFHVKKFTTGTEKRDVLLRQHKKIFDAIKGKNPREARNRVLRHLDYVQEVIIKKDFMGSRLQGDTPEIRGETAKRTSDPGNRLKSAHSGKGR